MKENIGKIFDFNLSLFYIYQKYLTATIHINISKH